MANNFKWLGGDVKKETLSNVGEAMTEFGLRCETAAKRRLQPGRGVRTGTLRRSIHLASPGYNWQSDNVIPANGTPERGNQEAKPTEKDGEMTLELGSGLEYAMAVHQGHDGFEGYHFLTEAVAEQKPKLPEILAGHKVQ